MPLPSPSAEDAQTLYLALHGQSLLVLAPDFQNVPTLVTPPPQLLRAVYLSPHEAADDYLVRRASDRLNNRWPLLILCRPSLDGPPFRTGLVFCHSGDQVVSWRADSMIGHNLTAQVYSTSLSTDSAGWTTSARGGGMVGYFLTGGSQSSDLWRVARLETDSASRWVFTLAPIKLAMGLPRVQFATVTDAGLRAEAEQHWSEFQNHLLGHQHYALVTSAKNVAETLLAYHLSQAGVSYRRDLKEMLEELADLLNRNQGTKPVPFDFMGYHLMQKMRLLHARTHPGRVAAMGRAMRPEFALTVAEDLVEVLILAGCAL